MSNANHQIDNECFRLRRNERRERLSWTSQITQCCIEIESYNRQEEMVAAIVNTTNAMKLSEKEIKFRKLRLTTKHESV